MPQYQFDTRKFAKSLASFLKSNREFDEYMYEKYRYFQEYYFDEMQPEDEEWVEESMREYPYQAQERFAPFVAKLISEALVEDTSTVLQQLNVLMDREIADDIKSNQYGANPRYRPNRY